MCGQQRLRPACAYAQSDQSLCKSLEYSLNINLLPNSILEFLNLKGGCIGWSESTLVKMPHCWKSHVAVHQLFAEGSKPVFPDRTTSVQTVRFRNMLFVHAFSCLDSLQSDLELS